MNNTINPMAIANLSNRFQSRFASVRAMIGDARMIGENACIVYFWDVKAFGAYRVPLNASKSIEQIGSFKSEAEAESALK